MKKILLALVVFGLVFTGTAIVGVTNANALCGSGYGKIVYTYTNVYTTTPYGYFYVTNTGSPTFRFYYYTNKSAALSQLMTAAATNRTVYIYGTATSCPTSGTNRYGGSVQYIYTYTNR